MENILINNYTSSNLDYNLNDELDIKFIETFNEIFKFNNKSIDVIGTLNNPWFCGKDVLNILEYEKSSFKKILQRLKESYKKSYREILYKVGDNLSPTLNGNNSKIIYINDSGLYTLIMNFNLNNAIVFKEYVI
ncbi:putative antirepressor [Betaentomopoxvirus amoorei]|uniref:AMV055 n=1 Tax=Amsacta moorei entomopoxvirus TaxID=28321 RepID=Q9EMZ4_AMEPV|nr:putative antirepressor [Amsacta moorei entomopoxvirus]AAG02761.1 AMV055 [Amsacta moorei entomopoxvirus]